MNGNDALLNSRAEMRRLKLQEAEREQQAEELEALKITEEQLNILKHPFRNVKFEFWDLDGLNWAGAPQYRAAGPVAWHADATPAMVSASTNALRGISSQIPAATPSSPSRPTSSKQGIECIDLTQPTQPTSSPSLNDYDTQATIRVKASKPRTRKPLSRVYSSNEIQLENAVSVPTLGAQGHSTSASSSTKASHHADSSSATSPSTESGSKSKLSPHATAKTSPSPNPSSTSENQASHTTSPKSTSRSRLSSKSRLAGAAIALATSHKSPHASGSATTSSLSKGKEAGAGVGLGLGLRVKEPGSPGPMRDLDFNSNFNSAFSASEFGTSSFLSASDLSSSLSSSTSTVPSPSYSSFSTSSSAKTYSTPPTPRFGMFDSFDNFDTPGDFEFDDRDALGGSKRSSAKNENEGYFGLSAMELYSSLIADEKAFRAAIPVDSRPSMPAWCTPRRERVGGGGAKGLLDLYETLMTKQQEEYVALGPDEWAKRQEQRRQVQPQPQAQGRGRDVYSVEPSPSPRLGLGKGGKGRGPTSLMDAYASLREDRDATRGKAPEYGSAGKASSLGRRNGWAYTSPDMAYEEMLQDNSAMYFGVGVGRGVYDLTPANSCPPSPAPERYEFVY